MFEVLTRHRVFTFQSLPNGLFPAAYTTGETQYTGYHSVWVRDNIYVALAHHVLGRDEGAIATLSTLMCYFKKHRWKFENVIHGEADPDDVMQRPHVRFDGETLSEIDQKWAHAQNDALGYFLWLYCQFACDHLIQLDDSDWLMLHDFIRYFQVIQYWKDEDNGHWEERRKIEASSMGVVIAGLLKLSQLLELSCSQSSMVAQPPPNMSRVDDRIADLIQRGADVLATILPSECSQPPPQRRAIDSALLFLIYPLNLLDWEQSNVVLKRVIEQLQGDYGIRRYRCDSFWAPDYKEKIASRQRTTDFSESMEIRDALIEDGNEAQWCIFDSIVSSIYGSQYRQTSQSEFLEKQIHYFNRALGQLTDSTSKFGGFRCPELYYLERGRYVPNDSTPLLWGHANLALAFSDMRRSLTMSNE